MGERDTYIFLLFFFSHFFLILGGESTEEEVVRSLSFTRKGVWIGQMVIGRMYTLREKNDETLSKERDNE